MHLWRKKPTKKSKEEREIEWEVKKRKKHPLEQALRINREAIARQRWIIYNACGAHQNEDDDDAAPAAEGEWAVTIARLWMIDTTPYRTSHPTQRTAGKYIVCSIMKSN